jgi:hypothetical protein
MPCDVIYIYKEQRVKQRFSYLCFIVLRQAFWQCTNNLLAECSRGQWKTLDVLWTITEMFGIFRAVRFYSYKVPSLVMVLCLYGHESN